MTICFYVLAYIHTSIKARINDFLRMIVSGGGLGQTVKRINKFNEFLKSPKISRVGHLDPSQIKSMQVNKRYD